MPMMQVALTGLNERFGKARLHELAGGDLDLSAPFGELTRTLLGDELPRGFDEFVDTMPAGLQHGLVGALRSALERGLPVTFAWAPGYDWELTLWDVADTADTHGGLTVLIRSRYPGDAHPLGRATAG
ncbi:MAG TPA: hypothetical protein VFU14_06955 [Acidimicrobiales bacterium]|nr:hypothetical protein [Acidimicrobiales bacterium]